MDTDSGAAESLFAGLEGDCIIDDAPDEPHVVAARARMDAVYTSLVGCALAERGLNPERLRPSSLVLLRTDGASWLAAVRAYCDCVPKGHPLHGARFEAMSGSEALRVGTLHRIIEGLHAGTVVVYSPFDVPLGAVNRACDALWLLDGLREDGFRSMVEAWSSDGHCPANIPPQGELATIQPQHWLLALRGSLPSGRALVRSLRAMAEADAALRPGRKAAPEGKHERLPPPSHKPAARDGVLTLEDCPGMGEAEEWARDLIRDLADYREGRLGWSEVDRGILLSGPPGVGKTRFAQCLAGSAGVPLVATSAAQWISNGGHLGTYVDAMKKALAEAAAKAPSILFIDEVDACGHRTDGSHNRSWTSAAVAALLEALDGATRREGVVVVAATNREEDVDPALRRSGRLDRTVSLGLPDDAALEAIFRVHLKGELADVDLGKLVTQARGGTGADVERWCREARRRARRGRRPLEVDDLLAVAVAGDGEPKKEPMGFRLHVHD